MKRNRFGFTRSEMQDLKKIKKTFDAPRGKTKAQEKKRSDKFVEDSIKFLLG